MNKRKILAIVMAVVMATAFLIGCGSKNSVKDDLINYDKEASKAIEVMKSSNVSDMDKFQESLNGVIKKIKKIDIKTDDVKDLNKLLIKAFEGLSDAYADSAKATKDLSVKLANQAKDKAEKAQKDMESFEKKYKALAKKEGVTIKLTVS